MTRKPGSGGTPTSDETKLIKKRRDLLIAAKNGSINAKASAQYLNTDYEKTSDILEDLAKNGYLTEEKKDLPDGSIFYSYNITPSGHTWLHENMSKKNKTIKYINSKGSVVPTTLASVLGIKLAYASNILRSLYADGLVDREKSSHSFSYSLSVIGVKRADWISTLE